MNWFIFLVVLGFVHSSFACIQTFNYNNCTADLPICTSGGCTSCKSSLDCFIANRNNPVCESGSCRSCISTADCSSFKNTDCVNGRCELATLFTQTAAGVLAMIVVIYGLAIVALGVLVFKFGTTIGQSATYVSTASGNSSQSVNE